MNIWGYFEYTTWVVCVHKFQIPLTRFYYQIFSCLLSFNSVILYVEGMIPKQEPVQLKLYDMVEVEISK